VAFEMKPAAIYARFSTELQNEKSTEDQIALCRTYAARHQLNIVATFEDKARSGASVFGRDGLMQLMDAARQDLFTVVIVEALDRLSRDMEDLAGIHKRLSFQGIEIQAVHDGTADSILIGIRGLVGQMQREDGAKKVRRGMAGVVRDGRHAGGRAYGYRAVPGKPGELEIVEDEAAIVRRIFEAYAAGRTPRDIAHDLNRENIRPPRGRRWNASTINGNAKRGLGSSSMSSIPAVSSGTRFRWSRIPIRANDCLAQTLVRSGRASMCLDYGSSNRPLGSRYTL
jgi:site-specific DNA recombinase